MGVIGVQWVQQTAAAWLHGRSQFASVVLHDSSILVMGGAGPGTEANEVWRSTDAGKTWNEQTPHAGWAPRYGQAAAVLTDGSIVSLGGYNLSSGQYVSDVWRSQDLGATWVNQTLAAPWIARRGLFCVGLSDGSIVIGGGSGSAGAVWYNDVWRSTDQGVTWTRQNAGTAWAARTFFGSCLLPDGSIVIAGGSIHGNQYYADVWRSTDQGISWTEPTGLAAWGPRTNISLVVLPDNSLCVLGGYNGAELNDVWRSTDGGQTWSELTAAAAWSARDAFCAVVTGGRIVVMGGSPGPTNDAWASPALVVFHARRIIDTRKAHGDLYRSGSLQRRISL